jgi:O-antigen ligase
MVRINQYKNLMRLLKNTSLLTNASICFFYIVFFVFNNLNIPLALIAILFIWLEFKNKKKSTRLPLINILIFLFLISLLISTITSYNSNASLRVIWHVIPGVMLYLLLAEKFDLKKINYLFHTFTAISIILSIILLFNYWQYPLKNVRELIKISHFLFMFTPNDTVILTFFSFFSFYILTTKPEIRIKLYSILGIILPLITIIIYQSRLSILISILFLFLYMIIIKKSKKLFFITLFCIVIIIPLVDMLNHFTLLQKLTSLATLQHRYHLWLAGWEIFLQHPILGSGAGSYGYLYQAILDNYGYLEFKNQFTPWPHNIFIELLAEQGAIGFTLFVLLIIQNLKSMLQFNFVANKQKSSYKLNKFLLLINLCYLFCLFFELTLHRTWVSFFLFTLLGISQLIIYKNNKNNKNTES